METNKLFRIGNSSDERLNKLPRRISDIIDFYSIVNENLQFDEMLRYRPTFDMLDTLDLDKLE